MAVAGPRPHTRARSIDLSHRRGRKEVVNEMPLQRWREEKASSWVYRVVADAEPDVQHATLFRALGKASDEQADIIARDIPDSDGKPSFRPTLRLHVVASLVRVFGPKR